MKLLSPKPSANCFVSTAINGSRNGASGIGFGPAPPLLRLRPLKPSVNNLKFSIFNDRFYDRKFVNTHFRHFVPSALAETSSTDDGTPSSNPSADKKLAVVAWSATTLVLGIWIRVFQKLALVPMKEYPFFLAQFNSFVYVAIYFSVLRVRYNAGITTDEMLAIPKSPFIVIGFLESISILSAMYAGAVLPGPAIPLLYQTFLVWQLVFSSLFLGRRYSLNQILGCFLVAAGVVVAVTSGASNSRLLSGIGPLWPAIMIASSAFQAGASIVKESVFVSAAARLKGKPLDIFIVSSFGSGFQALFILLFLPILSNMKGIPISELPSYFKSGAACFLNIGSNTIVPISIFVLSLPLPYLPKGVSLSPSFLLGSVILVVGLILYNAPWSRKQESDIL
ncbi:hypothetical protein DH2020_035717 [Rehmannia glutinosa]|uniref:Uncharacterized protein n=1 Tax=Rehmannia glutinosa TaxID=99300 RepID=A0ABR0V6F1_REHGL